MPELIGERSKESSANTRRKAIERKPSLSLGKNRRKREKTKEKNEPRTRQTRRLYDSLGGVSLALARSPLSSFPLSRHPRFARDPSTLSGVSSLPFLPAVFPRLSPTRRRCCRRRLRFGSFSFKRSFVSTSLPVRAYLCSPVTGERTTPPFSVRPDTAPLPRTVAVRSSHSPAP